MIFEERKRKKKGVDERVTAFLLHERSTGAMEHSFLENGKEKKGSAGGERGEEGGEKFHFSPSFTRREPVPRRPTMSHSRRTA